MSPDHGTTSANPPIRKSVAALSAFAKATPIPSEPPSLQQRVSHATHLQHHHQPSSPPQQTASPTARPTESRFPHPPRLTAMKLQSSIDGFLGIEPSQPTGGTSFLDLPPSIRQKIYELALPRNTAIDLSKKPWSAEDEDSSESSEEEEDSEEDVCPEDIEPGLWCFCQFTDSGLYPTASNPAWEWVKVPTALLWVSKTVSEEFADYMYGEGVFSVTMARHGGLIHLDKLGLKAVGKIQRLQIRLNKSFSYGNDFGRFLPCTELHCRARKAARIGNSTTKDRIFLRHWNRIFTRIAPHFNRHLKLSVICDVKTFGAAKMVVKPFFEIKVNIRACAIAFDCDGGKREDYVRLAKDTCEKAMGGVKAPFRYNDLPYEIQDMILAYAGLDMRRRQYAPHWLDATVRFNDFGEPINLPQDAPKTTVNFVYWQHREGYFTGTNELFKFCCGTCNITAECHICLCNNWKRDCYSPTCSCWSPPTNLFLVSRSMRQRAIRIFYSINAFAICLCNSDYSPHMNRFSLKKFLDRLPIDNHLATEKTRNLAIRSITDLTLIYTQLDLDPHVQIEDDRTWDLVLEDFGEQANLEGLTLRIHYHDDFMKSSPPRFSETDRERRNRNFRPLHIRKLAKSFLPFRHRIKRIFFYLKGDTSGSKWAISEEKRWESLYANLEIEAERIVMGREYSAKRAGKWRDGEDMISGKVLRRGFVGFDVRFPSRPSR